MYENVFMYSIILLIGVFIGAVSQVILKKAAMQEYDSKIKEYLNVRVIFAYILFLEQPLRQSMHIKGFRYHWEPLWRRQAICLWLYLMLSYLKLKLIDEEYAHCF